MARFLVLLLFVVTIFVLGCGTSSDIQELPIDTPDPASTPAQSTPIPATPSATDDATIEDVIPAAEAVPPLPHHLLKTCPLTLPSLKA